jgi:hypothetical protein
MMRAGVGGVVLGGLLLLAGQQAAFSQELLLHFPLDGTPAVAGSAAGDSKLYLLDGGPPPATVPGKFGSALYFNGTTAIAMPFKLDAATYPNVTVTAWVKVDAESTGERTVFSAGNGNVPQLMVYGDRANFTAARGSLMFNTRMPRDEWVFVAGVVDIANARLQTYQGDGQLLKEGAKVSNLYPPSSYRNPDDPLLPAMPYVFVGSHGFNQWRANKMAIDEVRIYAGALTPEHIDGIRSASTSTSRITAKQRLPVADVEPQVLPGDQFEPKALPGDQFEPEALPGDQFEPEALPGDQFEPEALPGDQFEHNALPGDQFDPKALPGDQF